MTTDQANALGSMVGGIIGVVAGATVSIWVFVYKMRKHAKRKK